MKILGYKNIPKVIMIITIVIILSNTILISLFYYINQLNEFDNTLKNLRYKSIQDQKANLKKDIESIVKMIDFKYKEKIDKEYVYNWISKIPFNPSKSDYLFVYELIDKKGGDRFAKMIINPNRPDIEGKYISTNYKDINGFAFREKFLKDINKKGDSILKYSYKKTNGKIGDKISYFYYYPKLNWIIAKGIYIEDIQQDIEIEKIALESRIKQQIKQNILFFIILSVIAVIITYIIGRTIQSIISEKDKSVKKSTRALAKLNRDLDSKVKAEVEKNKEQQKILMQKSKFVAMGEMISLIAHQWRQPISEINAIIVNMKLHHQLGKLDNSIIDLKTKEMEKILDYMSNTIDDFRTFFKPEKQKERFYFKDSFDRVLAISSTIFNEHKIILKTDIDETLCITNYQNEFEQVILNIISNAKDALIDDNIKDPQVVIKVYKQEKIYIRISDNAKGIDQKYIEKIFEPYFTTKDESKGTGIGLYMSKMIIEENMGGKLCVKSSKEGTCFSISFNEYIAK